MRMSQKLDERIETQISVIYGASELDETGAWQDTDGDTKFDVWVWVKNVGSARIAPPEQSDVFFGKTGSVERIPHVDDAGGSFPNWDYTLENGTEWASRVTLKITIHYNAALASDTYLVKVVTPSGAYDELVFSF